MNSKKYDDFMNKRKEIINNLEVNNIDGLILNNLVNYGIDIENTNIIYLKNVIKKMVIEYELYTRERTLKMLFDDSDHLYSYSKEERTIEKENIGKLIKSSNCKFLILNSEVFDSFVIKCADNVLSQIKNVKKLQNKM